MPTKTDRILSYLPSTFRSQPRPTALFSVTDAFGNELQGAENSLAAVMQAHWVDHADRFAELFADLPQFAALYGLAPREDEEIEEFRAHLKRYVRTFIEGTVTVQGILRIAAEALGLRIADAENQLDTWWTRPQENLRTTRARLDDAAAVVFGAAPLISVGADAQPASITGEVDLSGGVDLRGAGRLLLAVDGGAPTTVALGTIPTAAHASAAEVAGAINAAGAAVASAVGGRLRLSSPTAGSASRLTLEDADDDAAPRLLGLLPRRVSGTPATAATLRGEVDLSAGVDLEPLRYIRVRVDRTREAEIDLRGAATAHAALTDLPAAINGELGLKVAAVEGGALVLRSPTVGGAGSIELLPAAAQDATALVFGAAARFASGAAAQPARLAGHEVSAGLDLRGASRLALSVDGADPVTVDCAGADPAATRPGEVVQRVNAALGPVAGYNGHRITLTSPTTGPEASIAVTVPREGDAAQAILGVGPRSFTGSDPVGARLEGPSDPVDLGGRQTVRIALDGGAPRDVDLAAGAASQAGVTPAELAQALDQAFGQSVASVQHGRLVLASTAPGAAGRVAVAPLTETIVRRFVTRAVVREEAAETLLGVTEAVASGRPPTAAALQGTADLSHAVDLRATGWLRVAVDGGPAREISVAGPRPRATTLAEIVANLDHGLGAGIARALGDRLALISPTVGAASAIECSAPTPEDALAVAGLTPGTAHGVDAVRVSLLGAVDLPGPIDLSAAATVRLRVAGQEREVNCAGVKPAQTTRDDIVNAINTAFATPVASIEGPRIRLQVPSSAAAGSLDLLAPAAGADATPAILGIKPPRSYQGSDAQPARLVGSSDLTAGLALGQRRFLRVGVDGRPAVAVDLGAGAADPAHPSLEEAVAALGAALGRGVAAARGGHLVLSSPTLGGGARLTLEAHVSRDARVSLLGRGPAKSQGRDAAPPTITGAVDLLAPVDLSRRSKLVLAVDGGAPFEIDVAGAAPATTFLDEVVAAINARQPGLAQSTADRHLRLRGTGELLAVLPARVLEVVEYPAETMRESPVRLRHGQTWPIDDDGAAEGSAHVELLALRGIASPAVVNVAAAAELRVLTAIEAGGRLRLAHDEHGGLEAILTSPAGLSTAVPAEAIIVEALEPGIGPADALRIVRGRSDWRFLECLGTRFDQAHFDLDSFSGGPCVEVAVFDASRFGTVVDAPVSPVFGDPIAPTDPSVEVAVTWTRHAPGRFEVNLPAELPARFGARFDHGRFGSGHDQVELYADAVTEPAGDPHDLAVLVHQHSPLLDARHVPSLPLGWSALALPFRRAQRLTIGVPGAPAAIYLQEPDVPGFVELTARQAGPAGTAILVTAPRSGPASFDVTVAFEAARFESATAVVAGRPLSASAEDLLAPGPIGVLEAKATGIQATVRRERTVSVTTEDHNP